jgi:putative acetyltransferase
VSDAAPLVIRPIRSEDDAAVAAIIRAVMPEFGASGPGFAIHDPEVGFMTRAYDREGAAYFVVCDAASGQVLGGGGVAPLDGEPGVCELRKMYFLPAVRGRGAGARMLTTCLEAAKRLGYQRCYLETLTGMEAAQKLYRAFGFRPLDAQMGATGHFSCDRYYIRDLG